MRRLAVVVVPTVWADIDEQVLYIARDSIDNALAWEARLRQAINGLGDTFGYAVDEELSEKLGYEVRKLVFERTYLIHYRVDEAGQEIRVVRFRHGARRPPGDKS